MYSENKVWAASSDGQPIFLNLSMANRHGLIAGATGTGKTVTLKVLAESFSDAGVPVFLADIKGDLSGMFQPGSDSPSMQERIASFGLSPEQFPFHSYPCTYWDIYGKRGIPLRTTISEMGPLLLSRLMDLNPTQTDILTVLFKMADDQQLLLIDIKDLKAILQYAADNCQELSMEYGNITKQSVAAILRHVISLETQGGDQFFAEPALNIADWFTTDFSGKGMINILDSRELIANTTLYSAFLLWMLSELFETLPEIGDQERPRMVFFFDEAHLLFKDIPKALQDKIEQVVKLIRSKGVGIYFITQSPSDIPDGVLGQLGNKIQHALHAYTPADKKAVKAASDSFRENPQFKTADVISELGVGEALVSFLDENGIPGIVQRCRILPPQSLMGPAPEEVIELETRKNNLYLRYHEMFDRDSAYEFLTRMKQQALEDAKAAQKEMEEQKIAEKQEKEAQKLAERQEKEAQKLAERQEREALRLAEKQQKELERQAAKEQAARNRVIKSVGNTVTGTIGREIGNSIGKSLGGSFGKKVGGNLGASLGRNLLGTFLK